MASKFSKYLCSCTACGGKTSKAYARQNGGKCKSCVTGVPTVAKDRRECDAISRQERMLENGWTAYAREEGHYDTGDY